ncbi:VanZ family protein [Aquimarina longa]|uniref:VanZ family protein n=1 Tax=Aquimarina longa TaxID=1080221 RepID=UPI0009E70913|nr:VanZ family protein [Aquimarina longa]
MNIKNLLGHKFLLCLLIVLISVITWASLARFINPIGIKVKGSDKIGHFTAYFVLSTVFFLFLFFSEKLNKSLKTSIYIAFVVCVLYGILMEVLQYSLTTYRSSEWYDVIANTSGTVFALFIIILLKNKLIKIKQNNQIIS